MTDKKISQLPEITTPASADIIPVVDIDANTTKKITAGNLTTFINNAFPAETIRDTIGAMLTGNTETDITVTHDDSNDKINFVVSVSASNLPNNIDAAKIGDGSVSNAEFQRLDGLTADIQTQIDLKVNKSGDTMSGTLAMGNNAITTSSTVDGRDVATDGSKLDGIETGATADQTNAEIRAAVEAASDSNVFTDADHSKLNAIEASATADQTDAEIRAAVEAASDSNVFTDADHTKLNGIEASADVTDATNVTAAGALMDSELTNIAAVKGINQALTTTSSPTFAGITGPLTGNASTASALGTARTINLGGEVTGSASFDGSQDITITGTIAANSVGINELALNDGSNGQFIQTDGAGTITFASAIGSSVINNAAANRITTVNANSSDFDAESNLTFDGSTLALTGDMTVSGDITTSADINFGDNDKAKFGAANNLQIYADNINGYIAESGGSGNLVISGQTIRLAKSDGEIMLEATNDDKVDIRYDGTTKLETTSTGVTVSGTTTTTGVNINDGSVRGVIVPVSQDLVIKSETSDKDLIFQGVDGGSTVTALTLDMSEAGKANFNAGALFGSHINLNDNTKLKFGDSDDLEIYHDGNDSVIKDAGTGSLEIRGTDVKINNSANSKNMIKAVDGGRVELYYDNNIRLETKSAGIEVTDRVIGSSNLILNTVDSNEKIHMDASGYMKFESDGSEAMRIDSSQNVGIGTSSPTNALSVEKSITGDFVAEFKQGHSNAGNSYGVKIEGGTNASDTAFLVANQGGTNMFEIQGDGNVGIGTTSPGELVEVNGGNLKITDDANVYLSIDSTQTNGDEWHIFNAVSGTSSTLQFKNIDQSAVVMLLDESGKVGIGTTSPSEILSVTGNIAVSGTVDGRDLQTDGTKLDGIAAGATNVTNNNQLTNGAGYITSVSGNITQLTNNAGYVTSSGVTSVATGNGLSGGTITSTGTLTMSGSYSGSFSASGNITAYSSDERLKHFKGKIENALDKVDKLNGYYYEWNDTAKGIDAEAFKDGVEIGVNAQEVEAVMPEVVTEAPIVKIHELDTDYKTVHYDKLVPLLIESIKELKAEIEILKKDK